MKRTFFQGETVRLKTECRLGGVLTNADSARLTLENPVGTVLVPETTDMMNDGTGLYHYDYTLPSDAMCGIYKWHPVFTSASTITKSFVDGNPRKFEVIQRLG